ncbi:hypothetical protein INT44_005516 [Umbelopsis vinacea]|uniref:Uncharacterized protein n=1 Tax=Umbelopsis vinacea TaxID=44442 RepID=A0A8H7Q8M3_9FUNG|nr:hypothetical protein INT44_005516 [Umbelopsis vinacea]
MVNTIQFTLQKFDALELLDVRPHLGNSTSEYLQAAYTALRQLHDTNIRCTKFRTLMIANTSFRQETIKYKRDTALMDSLQQELEWLANGEQEQDEIQPSKTQDKILAHDLAICEVCESRLAHTSGNKSCFIEPCDHPIFNMCLSCAEYCSACDALICPDHSPYISSEMINGDYFLEGRCYHGNGEILRYCRLHEETNMCHGCESAQCEHHLQTCASREEEGPCHSGSRMCIDCCFECPICNNLYCNDCCFSENHETYHLQHGYPDLTDLEYPI